jgi:hypothetical protein
MNSFVMSHEAWLLFWSRSACPVCLPTGVCGVGLPAFNIGADNDQRNHFAASLWRQLWPGAMCVDILADRMKADASLWGRLPARCQMTHAMVNARTSDAPAWCRTPAVAFNVAPVVITSSINITVWPATLATGVTAKAPARFRLWAKNMAEIMV